MKIVADQEDYIRILETEFNVTNNDFSKIRLQNLSKTLTNTEGKIDIESISHKNNEKIDDFEIELNNTAKCWKDDKFNELEIFKLKKQLKDDQVKIEKLESKNSNYKKKFSENEESCKIFENIEREIIEVESKNKQKLEKMQAELNEKQKILNSKSSEFEKMLEISSKSEEKLKLSNEYNNYIEKNTTRINDETAAIYQEKLKIEDDLQDLSKKIEEKQIFISEIKKKIKSIKSSLEYENMKNKTLTTNIESAKGC